MISKLIFLSSIFLIATSVSAQYRYEVGAYRTPSGEYKYGGYYDNGTYNTFYESISYHQGTGFFFAYYTSGRPFYFNFGVSIEDTREMLYSYYLHKDINGVTTSEGTKKINITNLSVYTAYSNLFVPILKNVELYFGLNYAFLRLSHSSIEHKGKIGQQLGLSWMFWPAVRLSAEFRNLQTELEYTNNSHAFSDFTLKDSLLKLSYSF